MLVSVVLTFYNEEAVIPELLRRLRTVLTKDHPNNYELIFVNDASNDRSLELLIAAAREQHDIKIINMSRNFGQPVCFMAGMRHAQSDCVIYMDADLQDPPELIPMLIETWRNGVDVDVVYTTRRSRAGENCIKLWITTLGYKILHAVSDIELPMESGDFKLLSRRVVNELVALNEHKPYLRGLVNWVGFKQVQVFYDRESRYAGQSHVRVLSSKAINNFLDSALISFSEAPLKLALFLGLFVSLGAFVYVLVVFYQKMAGLVVPGWAAIMTTMLVLGGVQLLTMGIMGLYISAIHRECKPRPNYIIKSTFGFQDRDGNQPLPRQSVERAEVPPAFTRPTDKLNSTQ